MYILKLSVGIDPFSIFGAHQITLADIQKVGKSSLGLLVYALPVILLLILFELFFSRYKKHKNYKMKETRDTIFIGAGNQVFSVVMKMLMLCGAVWIYNILPWRMEFNWWTLVPCYIIYDFYSYWAHRTLHYNRFFWVTHAVHHSAEHFNLTVSVRQSWAQYFKLVFFIPVALLGFHPVIFFMVNQLSQLSQFWVHTESIGKLQPFIEKYFNTPSNHRVHHGRQEKYLNKNFGSTLMIWDHLFGSFQYEEEKPDYGISVQLDNKINPLLLSFYGYRNILQDVKGARGIRQKFFFIFASPSRVVDYKLNKTHLNYSITEKNHRQNIFKQSLRWITTSLFFLMILPTHLQANHTHDSIPLPCPKGSNLLFYLQRDPDANTVIYELNFKKDGSLHPENPVSGSWIRYSEQGQHKELNSIEKKFAYGVQSKALGKDEYEIRLAAYKKLPMYLKRSASDKKYRVYVLVENKQLLLKRVFVRVKGGSFWFPKVKYIDLFGTDALSGKKLMHRIKI